MDQIKRETGVSVPNWVPENAVVYLAHVEAGRSIRSLARDAGCHASTILRKVRRFEVRLDDPLVDLALRRIGQVSDPPGSGSVLYGGNEYMHDGQSSMDQLIDDAELRKLAPRYLRRLNETGACLAIARDMEIAVIVRDAPDGQTLR